MAAIGALYVAACLSLFGQAAGLPTVDKPRYAIILTDLKKIQTQVQKWAEIAQLAHDSIAVLGTISEGIRDLQGVVAGGVRGLTGSIAASVGLDDLFKTLRDVQGLYVDTQSLIHDIRALPDEAKAQLRGIGIETRALEQYLREGLMHDTLHEMGAAEWKEVIKNPARAIEKGSFGRALELSEDYLTEQQKTKAWRDYIASLSPEEQKSMSIFLGPRFAAHLATEWYRESEKRMKSVVDTRDVLNKLEAAVHADKTAAPAERDIASDQAAGGAVNAGRIKVSAQAVLHDAHAARVLIDISRATVDQMAHLNAAEREHDNAAAIAGGGN